MDEKHLYEQVAESVRKEILEGRILPGARLPTVRQLCLTWNCTPGTVQRAYQMLGREGLVISQAGRGTRVAGRLPRDMVPHQSALRKASLVHRSESFLLELLTAGYNLEEIQSALELAMDRWRTLEQADQPGQRQVLRFAGSHDMALNSAARRFFDEISGGYSLQISITGSMGGLLALKNGKADLAGTHLWDAASDTYNLPFIRETLPGIPLCLVTFAHRRLGLVVAPGNPLRIHGLEDLTRPEVSFVNRQAGSGTRVWLDSTLNYLGIRKDLINGYSDERMTHTDVARSIAEGGADAGLGLESAAAAYGLEYIHLTRERYDLVMREETARQDVVQAWIGWLSSTQGREMIGRFKGYEVEETGSLIRI